MPRKVKRSTKLRLQGDLFITIENQDWVAIHGTRAELAQLGQAILDFAKSEVPDEDCIVNDAAQPPFRSGSLGYIVYRRPPGWSAAV